MAKKCFLYTNDQLDENGDPIEGAVGIDINDKVAVQRFLLENADKLTPEDLGVKPKEKVLPKSKGEEYKSYITKAISQANVSEETKKRLIAKGLTYVPLTDKEAQAVADSLIAEFGGAEKAFDAIVNDEGLSKEIPPKIKVIIAGGVQQMYANLAKQATTTAEREMYADKEGEVAEWIDGYVRPLGQAIQAIYYLYKQSEWGVRNMYKRAFDRVNKAANEKADEVVPDIKDKVNNIVGNAAANMNEAANDVFGDNQKEIDDLKKENEELKKQLAEAPKGGKKNPVQLFKERAKKATGDIKDAYDLLTKPQTKSLLPEQMGALITVIEDMVRNGATKASDIFSALEQAIDPMYAEGFEQAYLSAKENLTDFTLDTEEEIRLAAENTANNIAKKIVANNAKIAAAEAKAKERKAKLDANKAFRDYEREHKNKQAAAKKEAEALIKKYEAEKSADRKKQIQEAIRDKENQIKEADTAFKQYENEILSKQRALEKETADLAKKYEAEQNKERKQQLKQAIEERRKNDIKFGIETAKTAPQIDLAERILKDAESLNFPKTKKQQDVLAKMLSELQRKAKDFYKSDTTKAAKSNKDLLNFAAQNLNDSRAIWNNAKQAVIDLIDADQNYSAAQKQQLKDFLNDYQNSIFDTLISENKATNIIKEALKEQGFVDANGAVDWKRIIGRANTSAQAKQAIEDWVKQNTNLPTSQVQPIIDQLARRYDNIVKDKIEAEIKKLLKQKSLGKGISPKIDKLARLAEQGLLNSAAIKDVLAEQFGIITMTPEQEAEFERITTAYANAPSGFLKSQAGEDLEGFLDRVIYGPRIQNTWDYVKGEATLALTNLPSVFTMRKYGLMTHLKNMSSFIDLVAEVLLNAIQTRSLNGIKVAFNELEYAQAAFMSVLVNGDVGTSASTNNELANTGKKYAVRTMEQRSPKFLGFVPDFFVQIGKLKANANVINAILKAEKYNPRLAEAVDSFNYSLMSASAQYAYLVHTTKQNNKSLTNKQANEIAYEKMYGGEKDAAIAQAKEEFKAMGAKPNKRRFDRRVLEIMVQQRDLSSRIVAEQMADEVLYKNKQYTGIFNGIAYLVANSKSFINQEIEKRRKEDIKRDGGDTSSRGRKSIQGIVSTWANSILPFVVGIGNIVERAAEFDMIYGGTKSVMYYGASFKKNLTAEEKFVMRQRSYKYAAKVMTGVAFTMLIDALMAASGDDDENETYLTGSKTINKQKPNTLAIFGMYIPLDFLGSLGLSLSQRADARFMEEDLKRKKGITAGMLNYAAKGNTLLDLGFLQGPKRAFTYFGGTPNQKQREFEKYTGSTGADLFLPFTGASRQFRNMFQPKEMDRDGVFEEFARQSGLYGNWLLKYPRLDYFGEESDIGGKYGVSTGDFFSDRKEFLPVENALTKRGISLQAPMEDDEEDTVTPIRYPKIISEKGSLDTRVMTRDEFDKFQRISGAVFKQELIKYYKKEKDFVLNGDLAQVKKDVSMIRRTALDYGLFKISTEKKRISENGTFIDTLKEFQSLLRDIRSKNKPSSSGYEIDVDEIKLPKKPQ